MSFIAVLISACGPVYKTDYRFQTPPTAQGKVCAQGCLDKMQSCQNACRAEQAECRHLQSLKAENAYLRYVTERQRTNQEIKKNQSDFESFSACNTDCDDQCAAVQRICHVNCGGNVTETRYCTAFCD